MKFKLLLLLVLPGLSITLSADTVQVSGVMNIFFGTATLSSGASTSQTMAVSADTEIGSGVPADIVDTVLTGLGPGIVDQILADPTVTSVMPGFVLAALPGLESANGVGSNVAGASLPALLSLLETQDTTFVVASDTGPQYFPDPSVVCTYEDLFGPFASHPGTTYDLLVNVNFYEDNLQLTATPEPASSVLLGASILMAGFLRFRKSSRALA